MRKIAIALYLLITPLGIYPISEGTLKGMGEPLESHIQLHQELINSGGICKYRDRCLILSTALLYEARGESRKGQIAVLDVITNRVKSGRYPNTIKGVIFQRKQFSYVGKEHLQKTPSKKSIDKAYKLTYDYLNGDVQRVLPESSLWYHTTKVSPVWSRKMVVEARIGNHIFYKEK